MIRIYSAWFMLVQHQPIQVTFKFILKHYVVRMAII
jgi:hypothetical protein